MLMLMLMLMDSWTVGSSNVGRMENMEYNYEMGTRTLDPQTLRPFGRPWYCTGNAQHAPLSVPQ